MLTKLTCWITIILCIASITGSIATAQLAQPSISAGLGYGVTGGLTDSKNQIRTLGRAFLRGGITDWLSLEVGGGVGNIAGEDFSTQIVPLDGRLLISPFKFKSWNPYLYGGYGVLYYSVKSLPRHPTGVKNQGWSPMVPAGIGIQMPFWSPVNLEVSGGYVWTPSDDLNMLRKNSARDAWWSALINFTAPLYTKTTDADGDGLSGDVEKQLGTDPNNKDTDGDGLSDGDEVNVYKTNPLKADTDGDGINDGDEIKVQKTDPNTADADGDGLSDGDEVLKYFTEPLTKDTDGDGLSDGDEVTKYHTDPLKKDSDGGTIDDGTEVARGTNPLDPADDLPKKVEPKKEEPKKEEPKKEVKPPEDLSQVEKGQSITFEGILFETGSAKISASSESTLMKVVKTLVDNPDIRVEIQGHTDTKGKAASNLKLSQRRADAVKAYLVKNGITAKRLTANGYGSSKPVASNDTPEGRDKNRRIEFMRTN